MEYYWRGQEKKAAPADQVKFGVGGFKVPEDFNYKPQRNPPHNPAQVPRQARDDQVIDSNKAAEKHSGVLVVDCRARDDQPIDCFEAAKKFDGILVADRDQTTATGKYDGILVVDYRARDQPIDCYEAAKRFGGILVVDNPVRDRATENYGGILVVDYRARDQPIDCYEAAKRFGGILAVDNPVRDQTTAPEKYGGQLMKQYLAPKAPPYVRR